jgi:hypothetical protein
MEIAENYSPGLETLLKYGIIAQAEFGILSQAQEVSKCFKTDQTSAEAEFKQRTEPARNRCAKAIHLAKKAYEMNPTHEYLKQQATLYKENIETADQIAERQIACERGFLNNTKKHLRVKAALTGDYESVKLEEMRAQNQFDSRHLQIKQYLESQKSAYYSQYASNKYRLEETLENERRICDHAIQRAETQLEQEIAPIRREIDARKSMTQREFEQSRYQINRQYDLFRESTYKQRVPDLHM